jgi:hypothetical protein
MAQAITDFLVALLHYLSSRLNAPDAAEKTTLLRAPATFTQRAKLKMH